MNGFDWTVLASVAALLFGAFFVAIQGPSRKHDDPAEIEFIPLPPEAHQKPAEAPPAPVEPPKVPAPTPPPPSLSWDIPADAFKLTRQLCDAMGLSVLKNIPVYANSGQLLIGRFAPKDIICACLFQESRFDNQAVCYNKNPDGSVWSRDLGIVQVNDFYHVGPGKRFSSREYLLAHPEAAVTWVIEEWKRTGKLEPWVSWTSGAFKQWLFPKSPMWKLRD